MSKKSSIPPFLLRPEHGIVHDQQDQAMLEQILEVADAFEYPEANTTSNWQQLNAKIKQPRLVNRSIKRLAMFRWVAAAVIVLTVAFGAFLVNQLGHSPALVYQTSDSPMTQNLSDGSQLQLNTSTVLEVQSMSKQNRVVYLKQGEVFCKVAHQSAPFKLITDKGIITVLGTEFDVKHSTDQGFSIYLKKGRISFQTGHQTIQLKPGDYLHETQKGQMVLTHISDNRATAWMDGALSFNQSPLSQVIDALEHFYQKQFIYDAALSNEKVTINLKGLDAQQAATLLSKTIGHSVQLKP